MPLDNKKPNLKTISPEMRDHQRIMSRMTPEEKKAYKWRRYDETAKPKLLELIEYCQSDNRIFPHNWSRIYSNYAQFSNRHAFTEYPPFKPPLILGASGASDIEKRPRLLTQIYWCYKNMFIGSMYDSIMKNPVNAWEFGQYNEDIIPLELIKKEYSTWLGLRCYPEYDIWNYCTNYAEKHKQIEKAKELYNNQEEILSDESITSIESR